MNQKIFNNDQNYRALQIEDILNTTEITFILLASISTSALFTIIGPYVMDSVRDFRSNEALFIGILCSKLFKS